MALAVAAKSHASAFCRLPGGEPMRCPRSYLLLALLPITICACGKGKVENLVSGFDPLITDAVFTATVPGGVTFSAPIVENITNESPPRYRIRNEFGNEGVSVGCQYVGRAVIDDTRKVDVYLISLKMGDAPEEHFPVIYSGGNKRIIEREEISISLTQQAGSN
jgi:hypothetical protein